MPYARPSAEGATPVPSRTENLKDHKRHLRLLRSQPDEAFVIDEGLRPHHRSDCEPGGVNHQRPCPWVSCRYHLFLDVAHNGSIKLNFSIDEANVGRTLREMPATCVLDVIDWEDEGITLEKAGTYMNITRERMRQLEESAIAKLHQMKRVLGLRGDDDDDEP
jgi:Sigma-70, region 4